MSKNLLSIAILTHNALEYTKKCIESIQKNTSVNYEILILDNGSTDGTAEYLESIRKDFKYLWIQESNVGVSVGREFLAYCSEGDVIVFLDNDVEVQRGWDLVILQELSNPDVGVVGAGGVNILSLKPVKWQPIFLGKGRSQVDAISGFCLAFKSKLLGIVGSVWVDFPNPRFWHEDLEFCKRVRLAGYKCILNTEIPIIHHEHKSMGDGEDDIMKEENQFGFKENAEYIVERFREDNVFTFYRNYDPQSNLAFDKILKNLLYEMRDRGAVSVVRQGIFSENKSFDLCKAFEIHHKGRRGILLYQENDIYPKSWEKELEDVDDIFIGGPHILNVLNKSKFKDKVVNLCLTGVDTNTFNLKAEPADLFPDKFKFLFVGSSQPRKNTENLIRTYAQTFTDRDDVVLIIKDGTYGEQFRTNDLVREIKLQPNSPQIEYIFEEMSDVDLAGLYRAVALNGAYVSPHRAECFGLPILEAVACGCRVGATYWGGPAENLFGIAGVEFFDFDLVDSKFHNWEGEPFYEKDEKPKWAEPRMNRVQEWFLHVKNQEFSKQEMNFETIHDKFSYPVIVDKLLKYYAY